MKPILNLDEVALEHHRQGERFEAHDGGVAERIGGRLLGASLTVVPPGKRAWPFHNHHVNEEMFVILAGTGAVRFGADTYPIRAGDVILAPPGGPETAHQIINTSDAELRYLSVSTMIPQDVVEYPDSGKTSIFIGSAPGGDPAKRTFVFRGKLGAPLPYWDGEA